MSSRNRTNIFILSSVHFCTAKNSRLAKYLEGIIVMQAERGREYIFKATVNQWDALLRRYDQHCLQKQRKPTLPYRRYRTL